PNPMPGLAPRPRQRLLRDAGLEPASRMEEVVALLHQHLAEARPQDFDVPLDAGLDHDREGSVQDRVGGHELAPRGPGLVEVGEVRVAGRVTLALGTAGVLADG